MSNKVSIFGASGMLGAAVLDVFAADGNNELVATVREPELAQTLAARYPSVSVKVFNAESLDVDAIASILDGCRWAVNSIGVIKPYIHDNNPVETERATRVNSLFPHLLAKAADKTGTTVLQIATDCVYSGAKGDYTEKDSHDALDVYGKSKSLGEVPAPQLRHLRCSIIGPEPKAHVSLLDWFLGQAQGASVNGFTNHAWNGVTTIHFGRLALGVVKSSVELPQVLHVVPSGKIVKSDLLNAFASAYGRSDITINPVAAGTVIDRTLATLNQEANLAVWAAAGYATPPTVEQMVDEMAAYRFSA